MKRAELQISDTLALPLAYATSRNMVLAQSGAGKSNVCVVLAEEMHRVKIPWIAIDTKGDWYGIRSSRNGKQRGLDVPVFGGEFGDMPLSPLAGARMAELVAAGKLAGVLDVSDFPKPSDVSRFLTDFANTLLKKQRTPVHLFLEECHDYLPQGGFRGQIDPMAAACVGAMKRLATKGRFRGIGYTLISQRAAEVNKTVLYQCETLIALRMVGDLDIKWIEGWVKRSSKRAPELLDTIHELRDGECWVWSPGRLKLIERVQARRRETFDSGQTPEIGQARVVPKMAPVEIENLRKELADLDEQAKADDPRLLRERIQVLDRELKRKPMDAPVVREVPVDWDKVDRWVKARLEEGLKESSERIRKSVYDALCDVRVMNKGDFSKVKLPKNIMKQFATFPPPPTALSNKPPTATTDGASPTGGLRRMMIALARRPKGLTNRQLGVRAGLSSKSGTFSTYMSRGRSLGWIADDGNVRIITDAGRKTLGSFDPLPEGTELLNYWTGELTGGAARMLVALANNPAGLTNEELGNAAGINHKSGTFSTYVSKLRTLELVEGRGQLRISEELT